GAAARAAPGPPRGPPPRRDVRGAGQQPPPGGDDAEIGPDQPLPAAVVGRAHAGRDRVVLLLVSLDSHPEPPGALRRPVDLPLVADVAPRVVAAGQQLGEPSAAAGPPVVQLGAGERPARMPGQPPDPAVVVVDGYPGVDAEDLVVRLGRDEGVPGHEPLVDAPVVRV